MHTSVQDFTGDKVHRAEEVADEFKVRVAWAYYSEGLTQAQIAKRMGTTRIRINRLLQQCRDSGLVQVSINSDFTACAQLEFQLEQRHGLDRAIVVPTPESPGDPARPIGCAAGDYATSVLNKGQTLGLGWGITLHESVDGVPYHKKPEDITVISLFGGLPVSLATNPYLIASEYAKRLKAPKCLYIAAPMYAPSKETCDTLRTQESFSAIYEQAARVDVALVGCGDMSETATNKVLGALSEADSRDVRKAGAVAEIFGYFIDREGNLVDHEINQRFTGPTMDALRAIPCTIVAAGGPQKISALKAVLLGKYANVLVTDEVTAQAVLS